MNAKLTKQVTSSLALEIPFGVVVLPLEMDIVVKLFDWKNKKIRVDKRQEEYVSRERAPSKDELIPISAKATRKVKGAENCSGLSIVSLSEITAHHKQPSQADNPISIISPSFSLPVLSLSLLIFKHFQLTKLTKFCS